MEVGIGVGILLDTLFDRAEELIRRGRNAAQDAVVEVGNQAIRTIDHARIAYSDMLRETVERLDPVARRNLDTLRAVIQEAETNAERITLQAGRQAQQIANTLPLHETQPQLTRTGPRFICRQRNNENVTIQFIGNFLHSARPGCEPTLSFGGDGPYNPTTNETQLLEFRIPRATLFPRDLPLAARGIAYRDGVLRASWETGGIFNGRATADFHVSIGCLPDSPGTIELHYTTVDREMVTRDKTEEFHLDSCNHHDGTSGTYTRTWVGGDNNDHIDHDFITKPSEGWDVSSRAAEITQVWNQKGAYEDPRVLKQDDHSVTIRATTRHIAAGCSGRLDFRVAFKEQKLVITRTPHVETILLPLWGDSLVFTPRDNWERGWKVILEGYDESHHEFAGSDQSHPLLHVTAQTEGYKIKSIVPQVDPESIA